jgi:hypothetical protein
MEFLRWADQTLNTAKAAGKDRIHYLI